MIRKMRRVSGQVRYFNPKECKEGDLLVEGWYDGEIEGKFGQQHQFRDLEDNFFVASGGHLNYLVEKFLEPGDYCKLYFDTMSVMPNGKFKGKEVKQFILEVEDRDEPKPTAAPREPSREANTSPWETKAEEPAAKEVVAAPSPEPVARRKRTTKPAEPVSAAVKRKTAVYEYTAEEEEGDDEVDEMFGDDE